MSCSASGDSQYSGIGHLLPELLLALGRPPAEPADEVRELLFPFERGPLAPIERGERLGRQTAECAQLFLVLLRLLLKETGSCA